MSRRSRISPYVFPLLAASGVLLPSGVSAQGRAKPQPAEADRSTAAKSELNLAVGDNRTISAAGVANYSEGTPGIVDIKLTSDKSQFVVVGQKPGSTSLLLIKNTGQEVNWTINVFSRSPEIVESEVSQLLEGFAGVRLRRVGSRFFIEGGVNTEGDLARIRQIASLYPGQVEALVAMGSGGSDRQTNIRVDFFFVQYNKSRGYAVGIGWPGRVGGEFVTSNFGYDFVAKAVTAQTNIVNQPLPGLDIASRYGWAKVMKQATVITTNGTEAVFQNGGEQNFPVSAGLTGAIQKIPFGTQVTVLPRFDPEKRDLEVKVEADVSDLVPPIRATNLPGRQTSHLSTLVRMKLGQSLVLSGIHSKSESKNVEGLPVLSDIPVLGVLFGSQSKEETEVEGAVFIVPSVVDATNRPVTDMVHTAMDEYEEFTGKMRGVDVYVREPWKAGSAKTAPAPAASTVPAVPPSKTAPSTAGSTPAKER
ncbi:MAG: pilus assembly protein N-terminal domain-containing protein [Polyangiaceae bacterium]